MGGGVQEKAAAECDSVAVYLHYGAVRNNNREMNRAEGGGRAVELCDRGERGS